MKARARVEEASVSFDYLKQLHDLHENWLIDGGNYRPTQVLLLNADLDIDKMRDEYTRVESEIRAHISQAAPDV